MSADSDDKQPTESTGKLRKALATLLEAFDYSVDTKCDRWDFAVPMRNLLDLGLNEADLRFLVRKGYAAHAREVTLEGDDGRQFRSTGDLTFSRRSCLVLTDVGVASARSVGHNPPTRKQSGAESARIPANSNQPERPMIHWDAETRRLRVNGQLVKRFKWPAANQETILNAFQEEGWPDRIDDPLPPKPEQDPKRRLSDTIKCLNRNQTVQLIHFSGDGTGEGVLWELVQPDSESNGAL
jgi:hypothetical protein